MDDAEPEDPRIAAFARAGRRRKAIVFVVLGVLLVVAGALTIIVLLGTDADLANTRGMRSGAGYQVIVLAGGAVLVGVGSLVAAYRVGRGTVDDVDLATMTIGPDSPVSAEDPLPRATVLPRD